MNKELLKITEPVEIDARKRIEQINNMPVANRVDFDKASEWLNAVVKTRKEFEKVMKEKVAPLKAEIDDIKAVFKKPLTLLEDCEKIARDKLNAYLLEERRIKEAEARKIEEARRKEAEKELKKLDRQEKKADKYDEATADAVKKSIEDKRQDIIAEATKPVEINQSGESATVRMVWTFEVTNLSDVPAEFLQINEQAVRQAIKNGVRDIAGLKIYQKPSIAVK